MATELILVRHGETKWNDIGKFQGSKDVKLNQTGIRQAEILAERLSDLGLDKIYSSTLQRANETANIVASKHQLEVEKIAELKEINFGVWEGLCFAEIKQKYDFTLKDWLRSDVDTEVPGGESLLALKKRAVPALKDIVAKHQDEKILIVAHGGVNKVLLSQLLEMPLKNAWSIEQDNTAVNKINFYQEYLSVGLLNCTAHLDYLDN